MKPLHLSLPLLALAAGSFSGLRATTHGDNLLGAGTVSRSLGGVGVAAAPGVTGAVVSNPATLGFLSAETLREAELSATFFQPRFTGRAGGREARSDTVYSIPTLGLAGTLGGMESPWRYGFAAYVVSGLGGDYRNSALDTNLAPTPFPLVATTRAELQVVEVAPSVSYLISPEWSAGLSLHLDHGSFNLGRGEQNGLGVGIQPGLVYRPDPRLSFGLTYVSPATVNYKNLFDFDNNGSPDGLKLESPPQVKLGAAYELVPGRLQIASELGWVNWGGAKGYRDFDWQDSWVVGSSVQWQAVPGKLVLRAGYTFGTSPVEARGNFNGAGVPGNTVNVQGKNIPTYYYEAFRIISFPAIAEHHLSLGLGWKLSETWTFNAGLTHAFKNTITEQGTNLLGAPTTLSSSLAEDSVEIGLTYRY